MLVKQIGDEGEVELVVAVRNVVGSDELATVELVGFAKHGASSRDISLHGQWIETHAGLLGGDLVEQVGVQFRIDNIRREIVQSTLNAGLKKNDD